MLKSFAKSINASFSKTFFGKEAVTLKESFYELIDRDMNGKEVPMSSFQDNVLLLINVASK